MENLKFELPKEISNDPIKILEDLTDEIQRAYNGKLSGFIGAGVGTEIETPVYNYYLTVNLDRTISYPLLQLIGGVEEGGYPYEIRYGRSLEPISNKAENKEQLFNLINDALKKPLVQNIINNLVAQAKLYQQSRAEY